ncbi:MAG: T9SS type A sorting domain-containing protein, partial [Cyclobacteriaceae bacterium]|nr:T9SS type A sorting domain-containing protein [Cyclobacteriaceae bacterium]
KGKSPSARKQAICWTDPTGDLWLYGGKIPETMTSDQKMYFNDLWKYNLSWPADVNAEVLLYPNPATDHITLKWDQAAPRHLFVYNIRSQRVIETGLLDWEERIEVRGLSPGLYRFLITEDGRYTAVSVVIK